MKSLIPFALPVLLQAAALQTSGKSDTGGNPESRAAGSSPRIDSVSFDNWRRLRSNVRIQWSLRVLPAALSEEQRLVVPIRAEINRDEVLNRADRAQLLLMLEIRDQWGHAYPAPPVPIIESEAESDEGVVVLTQNVFMVPGRYQLAAAIYDPKSEAHNLKQTAFQVPDFARDPMHDVWRNIPRVAFSNTEGSARLWLPLQTKRPVRVDLLVNQSVTGHHASVLKSRLQIISQLAVRNGSMHMRILDLSRQRVAFSQDIEEPVDITRVAPFMGPGDLKMLRADVMGKYEASAQFFVEQIRGSVDNDEPSGGAHAIIILSTPWKFPKSARIPLAEPTRVRGARIFFIRCDSYGHFETSTPPANARLAVPQGAPPLPAITYVRTNNSDSLASTLKPLHLREFHVITAAEFRHALGEIMNEISHLN